MVLAKAYRLLRAVLNTAVTQTRILTRNPCQVPGADKERPEERPVLSVEQVFKIADGHAGTVPGIGPPGCVRVASMG